MKTVAVKIFVEDYAIEEDGVPSEVALHTAASVQNDGDLFSISD